MKTSNFNKIGDTCYRIKNQINGYISFAQWFLETDKNKRNMESFKEWTKENNVYNYNKVKIKYYNMILRNALEKYKVIKKNSTGEYIQNFEDNSAINDILNNLTKTNEQFKKRSNETCVAFREMLNFMIDFPHLNNAKKIFYSFATYQKGDNFVDLYNKKNIFEDISNKILCDHSPITILEKCLLVPKKSKELKEMCSDIINHHNVFSLKLNNFKKLKKHYLHTFSKCSDFENFVKKNDLKIIVFQLLINRYKSTLEKEYFSLFNYVMWGFNLVQSPSINIKKYMNNNVQYNDGVYSIKTNGVETYPYTLKVVNDYLISIQHGNYNFCDIDRHLFGLKRAIIAEYFVNLKFCYLFNIPFSDIQKYVNTSLDKEMYPINCAPGRKADMNYFINKKLWSIETTIHNTSNKIINHECLPCLNHLNKFISTFTKEYAILILIQPIGNEYDINDWFENNGKRVIKANKFLFKTFNFEQLSKLSEMTEAF